MLGLAGGTAYRILRHLLPECQLAAIDIDPEIVDLARTHMDLDAPNIEVHTVDAYPWLERERKMKTPERFTFCSLCTLWPIKNVHPGNAWVNV